MLAPNRDSTHSEGRIAPDHVAQCKNPTELPSPKTLLQILDLSLSPFQLLSTHQFLPSCPSSTGSGGPYAVTDSTHQARAASHPLLVSIPPDPWNLSFQLAVNLSPGRLEVRFSASVACSFPFPAYRLLQCCVQEPAMRLTLRLWNGP